MIVTLRTKQRTFEFPCESGERILYAALAAGVPAPYECASGTCGTCRARVKSGEIEELWPDAPGKTKIKPERAEFLMCQCSAESNIEILVPGTLADTLPASVPVTVTGRLSDGLRLTHDVMRFHVDLDRDIPFAAGQFLVFQVDGMDGYRAYSMTNHSDRTSRLDFVVKKKPGGGFSERLFDGELNGRVLTGFGPLGEATLRDDDKSDLICLAGGSGIAGIMSILAAATASNYFEANSCTGHVIFGVRTMEDVFFADELNACIESHNGRLSVTIALSDQPVSIDRVEGIDYASGFVHEVASRKIADNAIASPASCTAFVAGPPPMVDASIRLLLTEARVPVSGIRYDKFN